MDKKTAKSIVYNNEEIFFDSGGYTKEETDQMLDLKSDLASPNFVGTPTINNTAIATIEDIGEITKGDRGRAILNVTTAPYSNIDATPDKKMHPMRLVKSEILKEANIDDLFVGDIILYDGTLYVVALIGYNTAVNGKTYDVYVDNMGSIKGPQGLQGIQGNQGLQGPKGDPGEGYYIVTDEDYEKIADYFEEKGYHFYQRPTASEPIKPNIFYDFGLQYTLDITLEEPTSQYRTNEYMFQFISPTDKPTTLILPSSIKWCYDPVIQAGKTYQISILNDLAVICGA